MIKSIKITVFLGFMLVCSPLAMLAQSTPEAPASTTSKPEEDEFAKKKPETKITEVIPTDSVPASELLKRATNWMKGEKDKYKITNAATSGTKAECLVSFPTKPKELNPQVDYTGKITMKVVIECKDSKYRYTISEIKHLSKSGKTTGGSIDNTVAECGSMGMNDLCWKRLKGEALRDAGQVALDIKTGMNTIETEVKPDEW